MSNEGLNSLRWQSVVADIGASTPGERNAPAPTKYIRTGRGHALDVAGLSTQLKQAAKAIGNARLGVNAGEPAELTTLQLIQAQRAVLLLSLDLERCIEEADADA